MDVVNVTCSGTVYAIERRHADDLAVRGEPNRFSTAVGQRIDDESAETIDLDADEATAKDALRVLDTYYSDGDESRQVSDLKACLHSRFPD